MPLKPWTRAELVLTLDLYFKKDGKIPDTRDPNIISLASELAELGMLDSGTEASPGRSRAAVVFKLSNFRALDLNARKKGKTGLSNVGKEDKKIWEEFSNNQSLLQNSAAEIRKSISRQLEESVPLIANLHILRLLGDELIGSQRLAIFELVKNAYDADAEFAKVRLDLNSDTPKITISDNGEGMSIDTIRNGWLQIGTPSKRTKNLIKTEKFKRLPLGEKGVGRLAAFKLGDRLELTTKRASGNEYRLVMDLENILNNSAESNNSIEDVRVRVISRPKPLVFTDTNAHGTQIVIKKLRPDLQWTRGELRNLQRLINSLSSPFIHTGKFRTDLEVPGRESEISGLPDINQVIMHAIWEFRFILTQDGTFKWRFRFRPPAVFRGLSARQIKSGDSNFPSKLEIAGNTSDEDKPSRHNRDKLFFDAKDLQGIGPITGRFYIYDLRSTILKHIGGTQAIRQMLQQQGGVRVYRDTIRVFNYGEPGDDWLELNIKRVNKPGETLATNSVLSAINLKLNKSRGLKEKTNREGFDENDTFFRFQNIIYSIVEHINLLRQKDREAIDALLKGDPIREDSPVKFQRSVDEILAIASKDKNIKEQIAKPLERIRKEYETLQEVVASSGAGLNLAIVFHEVEREVRALADGLRKGDKLTSLNARAEILIAILDGFSGLLKKATKKTMPISTLINRALQLSKGRFSAHKITVSCPVLSGEEEDFNASGAFNFYLQVLLNLIDNAIYWVRKKAEIEGDNYKRAIQIRLLHDWAAEGPCLAVLDNGPGFSISPEEAIRAYSSTKPGGMGLGLFFSRTAMESNGGELLIPGSIDDLDIDTVLDGGAVIMRFRRSK